MTEQPRVDAVTGRFEVVGAESSGSLRRELAAIAGLGAVVRVVYVFSFAPRTLAKVFADSFWYYQEARNLRHGLGLVDINRQFGAFNGHAFAAGLRPTAYWPPGYPAFLAVVQSVFGDGVRASQLAGVASGAATIVLTGLLGRAIVGRAVGLLAALLVALNPLIIAIDGSLMSETLYLPLVLLALLLAQRAREHMTARSWIALGAVIGAATLVRQDALLLLVFAALPAAILSRARARDLIPRVVLGLTALALLIAPWVIRNEVRIGTPAIGTLSASTAISGANCKQTYNGPQIGFWNFSCTNPELGYHMGEAAYSTMILNDAGSYAFGHMKRWTAVLPARVLRVWGLWSPSSQAKLEARESRNVGWQEWVWVVSLLTLGLGIAGFRILAKQGAPIALLLTPLAMTTLIALASYGNSRFRGPAECTITIGAAAALHKLRVHTRPSGPAP